MDKGWGLTLDTDHPHVSNFFSRDKPSSARFRTYNRDSDNNASLSPSDDNRVAVDEVDFFSDRQNTVADHNDCTKTTSTVHVKKESSPYEPPHPTGFDVNTGLHLLTANTGSDQSTVDDGVSSDHFEDKRVKDELAQLQAELQQLNTENQKLKDMLSHVTSNYNALQIHIVSLMQQQQQNHRIERTQEQECVEEKAEDKKDDQVMVPRQFIHLGPSAETDEFSNSLSEERTLSATPPSNVEVVSKEYLKSNGKSEMVSLDQAAFENSNDKRIGKEESLESETQGWGTSNEVRKFNSADKGMDQSNEATMRKVRVSVRARSEAPMISDGCQWRKYGQKMAKGNPCPRAYYRCTMAIGCPVRKQVQRCAEDRTILITTYEGNHNHPLPPAAMAMASTTAAAAKMLLSGSMSSADGIMNPNLLARAIFPCSSSMATISASAPFPTITLDLTHSPNPLQIQRQPSQFQIQFPGQPQNFGTATSPQLPQVFGQPLYNQSKFSGLQLSQDMGSSSLFGSHQSLSQPLHNPQLSNSLSAAMAAITADPNFPAALAAAISSIIGGA